MLKTVDPEWYKLWHLVSHITIFTQDKLNNKKILYPVDVHVTATKPAVRGIKYKALDILQNNDISPSMQINEAWNIGYTGRGIKIAILDDGLQTDHADLVSNVVC